MMRKITSLIALLAVFFWLSPAVAAKPHYAPEFPENDGLYDVPGQPNLKVRIFVHKTNPAKPGSNPTPIPGSCTADGSRNNTVSAGKWKLPSNFSYRLNLASAPAYVSNLETIAGDAFGVWTRSIAGAVTMTKGANTDAARSAYDGQNIIAWGRTSGSALGVTYIIYNTLTGEAVDVDTIMNSKFFWTSGGTCFVNSYDAQDILTHELGHWFGLLDHYTSDYTDNTMFGYGSKAEIKKSTLEIGDIAGINSIY